MDEIEEAFRDGLRDAVSGRPPIDPIGLDEVIARAGLSTRRRRPIGRWVGLAAAVTIAAGLGLWAIGPRAWAPVEPRVLGTPGGGTQVRTLRIHNDTGNAYHRAALQLSDGRTLALGDVPAGGTVLLPMDATSSPAPSGQVATSGGDPRLRVVYSGDCSASGGQLVAFMTDSAQMTIQVVVPSGQSTAGESAGVNATIAPTDGPISGSPSASSVPESTYPAPGVGPTSGAPADSVPTCTITIVDARPTPKSTHSPTPKSTHS
jgi:hypothetical protein